MEPIVRRKPVTLTVAEDALQAAKQLSLNASQAAEVGIRLAIREARTRQWLAQNSAAVDSYNSAIERDGLAIQPLWQSR